MLMLMLMLRNGFRPRITLPAHRLHPVHVRHHVGDITRQRPSAADGAWVIAAQAIVGR